MPQQGEGRAAKPPMYPSNHRKGLRNLATKLARLMGDKSVATELPRKPAVSSKFDADEIEVLRKMYKELNVRTPEEGVDKETFLQYFPLPGVWGERLFMKFDFKKQQRVDYEDLTQGLAICCRGTKAERVKVLFELFDLNGDGKVSREELTLLLSNVPNIETYIFQKPRKLDNSNTVLSRSNSKGTIKTGDLAAPSERSERLEARRSLSSSSLESHLWDDSRPFCSTTSWKSSTSGESVKPEEEEERYVLGAGPSPMVAELLARANTDGDFEKHTDIESIVNTILDSYDVSGSDSLSYDDFKSFVDHYPRLLRLFSDCLREEFWGLQGHALYRRQRQPSNKRRLQRLDTSSARSSSFIDTSQPGGDTTEQAVDLLRLEKWIRIQQLFTEQGAPRRLGPLSNSAQMSKLPSREMVADASDASKSPNPDNTGDSGLIKVTGPRKSSDLRSSDAMSSAPPVNKTLAPPPATLYPRRSRYAGSREVLDFLETSLGQCGSDEEDLPTPPEIWQQENLQDALSCPHCLAPLLICPKCDRKFPVLRLRDESRLTVDCRECIDGKPRQYAACWVCQWPFKNAVELIDKHETKMEGSLWKIGKSSKKWACRHFILMDKLLYYYQNPNDNIPKGFIFLDGCFVDPITTPGEADPGRFGFCIVHGGGNFSRRELFAEDESTRDRWVAALRSTLSQQPIDQLYVMKEVIGHGKFSLVYRATEKSTGENFAIKVIQKSKMTPYEKELLRGEMNILRLLRHPHVIYLNSLVTTRDALHIVMELVSGGELFEAVNSRGPLPEIVVNRLCAQLLRTLMYLHKAGIVHRDLKPENILLTSKNVEEADIKIADFGLSCLCGPGEKLFQPCGTLVYVAPEVLTLQGYNHAVDYWSLGVTIYLLLCGKLPFPIMRNSGVSVLTEKEKFYTPKFDGPAWKTVSLSARDFVSKLLQIDPEKRLIGQEALNHIWIKNPSAVLREGKPAFSAESKPPGDGSAEPRPDVPADLKAPGDNGSESKPEPPRSNLVLVRTGTDDEIIESSEAPSGPT